MKKRYFVILAVVLIAIGLIGGFFSRDGFGPSTTVTDTFPSAAVDRIQVNGRNVRVEVETAAGDEIRVVTRATGGNFIREVELQDSTLVVDAGFNQQDQIRVGININVAVVTIYVPAQMLETVDINTTNSRIEAVGLTAERISLRTTNARIDAAQLSADQIALTTTNASIMGDNFMGNQISLTSTNGSIEAANFDAADTQLRTTNNRITASHINGSLEARSTNGRLDIQNITGNVLGLTTNNSISFENPGLAQNIDFETTNGRLDVAFGSRPDNGAFNLSTTNSTLDLFGDSARVTGRTTTAQTFGVGQHQVNLSNSNGRIRVR